MDDLRTALRAALRGRVCLVGIDNPDLGDDGFGPRLAAGLQDAGVPHVVLARTTPERWVTRIAREDFDTVVFLDAVELGAEPGAVILAGADELDARLPQVSTHKFSLGSLARLVEATGRARVWLLGAQPASLRPGFDLTPPLRTTLELLRNLLSELLPARLGQADPAWERP